MSVAECARFGQLSIKSYLCHTWLGALLFAYGCAKIAAQISGPLLFDARRVKL